MSAQLAKMGTHQTVRLHQLLATLLSSNNDESCQEDFKNCNKLELIELANLNFMSFALYHALKQKQLLAYLQEYQAAYLKEFFDLNRQRNQHFLQELNKIVLEFNKLDIDVVLLKGAVALLDGWYEDMAERFLRDIDLLVPQDKAQQAFEHLLGLGYELVNPLDENLHELQTHQLAALHRKGSPLVVELHIAPITLKAKGMLTNEQVFRDKVLASADQLTKLVSAEVQAAQFYMPCAQHCLLIALAHTQIADNNRQNQRFFLRHGMDIERILNRYGLANVDAVNHIFESHGFQNLLPEYLQTLDFFFGSDFLEASSIKYNGEDKAHLKQILDKLIQEQESSKSLSTKQNKRRYLRQQTINAFSKERIHMRYGVSSEPAVTFYRGVNLFRLFRKYAIPSNRKKLSNYMDESLNTKKILDKS